MSDETIDNEIEMTAEEGMDSAEYGEKSAGTPPHSDYDPTTMKDSITHHLRGMYQNWFLDYARYVILERAVPHGIDGLKPVQTHTALHEEDGRRALQQGGEHRGPHHAVSPSRRCEHKGRIGADGSEGLAHRLPGQLG